MNYMCVYMDKDGVERYYYADTYKEVHDWHLGRDGFSQVWEMRESKK